MKAVFNCKPIGVMLVGGSGSGPSSNHGKQVGGGGGGGGGVQPVCQNILHATCHPKTELKVNRFILWPSRLKGGAYPTHARLLWKVISLQLFAAETCNKFLKIEHHDSIVYRKNERILTFLAGATSQSSNLTVGNTTQEPLDLLA